MCESSSRTRPSLYPRSGRHATRFLSSPLGVSVALCEDLDRGSCRMASAAPPLASSTLWRARLLHGNFALNHQWTRRLRSEKVNATGAATSSSRKREYRGHCDASIVLQLVHDLQRMPAGVLDAVVHLCSRSDVPNSANVLSFRSRRMCLRSLSTPSSVCSKCSS